MRLLGRGGAAWSAVQVPQASSSSSDAAACDAPDPVPGLLEDLNQTLTVLEHYVPRFFKGALDTYYSE